MTNTAQPVDYRTTTTVLSASGARVAAVGMQTVLEYPAIVDIYVMADHGAGVRITVTPAEARQLAALFTAQAEQAEQ